MQDWGMQSESEDLERDYAAAWREWATSEDARLWERTIADGLDAEAPTTR